MITPLQEQAVAECLGRHIPFALYVMPEGSEARFMASLPDADGHSPADTDGSVPAESFFLSRYTSDEAYAAGVRAAMDERELVDYVAACPSANFGAPLESPYVSSTRRMNYDEAFREIRKRVKVTGGKGVLSRHVAVYSNRDITDVAADFFRSSPGTFRYLAFTPETGMWIGATPELFASYDPSAGVFETMALAGTVPADVSGDDVWDEKNRLEHQIVVDFITAALRACGLEPVAGDRTELRAGAVKHLCTPVSASGVGPERVSEIMRRLNPTPAVAGWPLAIALTEIDALETHQRRCYAGLVGVSHGGAINAFVNLRCAFACPATLDGRAGWLYNLYAGGGILAASQLADEWTETERKMQTLLSALDPHGNTADPLLSFNPVEVKI